MKKKGKIQTMSNAYAYEGDFTEFTTMKGEKLRVFTPPLSLINGIVPDRSRPRKPVVQMETKGGKQGRLAKEGDPGFEEWQEEIEKWEDEQMELQTAARLVTALRDYEYPSPITKDCFPKHVQQMFDDGLVQLPENSFLLKARYLQATALESQQDGYEVGYIIQLRSGVPAEVVEQIKRSFRDRLLRTFSVTVDENHSSEGAEQSDGLDEPVVEDSESG